jgi:TetR/AcrR family transcriptional regulator, cholesterol catabolism regulator
MRTAMNKNQGLQLEYPLADQVGRVAGSKGSKRQRRPEEPSFVTREEIIEAAADLFFEKGYASCSIQEIADQVGILKGSIYHHLSSKDELLFEVIKKSHAFSDEIAASVEATKGGAVEKLTTFIRKHIEVACANIVVFTVFLRELRLLSPEARKIINQYGDAYRKIVRDLLVAGQAAGEIDRAMDAHLVSVMVVEMLNSIYRWYQQSGEVGVQVIADNYVEIILNGLIQKSVS